MLRAKWSVTFACEYVIARWTSTRAALSLEGRDPLQRVENRLCRTRATAGRHDDGLLAVDRRDRKRTASEGSTGARVERGETERACAEIWSVIREPALCSGLKRSGKLLLMNSLHELCKEVYVLLN